MSDVCHGGHLKLCKLSNNVGIETILSSSFLLSIFYISGKVFHFSKVCLLLTKNKATDIKEHRTRNSISKIPEGSTLSVFFGVFFVFFISTRSLHSQHCQVENMRSTKSKYNIS